MSGEGSYVISPRTANGMFLFAAIAVLAVGCTDLGAPENSQSGGGQPDAGAAADAASFGAADGSAADTGVAEILQFTGLDRRPADIVVPHGLT